MVDKNSMLYWWPKIKDLPIPKPKTVIVEVPYNKLVAILDGKPLSDKIIISLVEGANQIGYPLFMRTDMASAKWHWNRTCFTPDMGVILRNVWSLIEETLAAGMFGELDPNAIVFREFLKLNSFFTAFEGLPISAERRYFVRNGIVECHHPYWIHEAIEKSWRKPSEEDWRERLAALNKESAEEIKLLTNYATKVGTVLEGYWSVDFAEVKGRDGVWYLIDMAEGDKSWHPEH